VNIVILAGTEKERAEIIANGLIPQDFEACITSYEFWFVEKVAFKLFALLNFICPEIFVDLCGS
jgi:hypothetical protein